MIRKFSQSRLPLAVRLNLPHVTRQVSVLPPLCSFFVGDRYTVSSSSSVGSCWKEIVVRDIFSRVQGDKILCCSMLFSGLWLILRDLYIERS